MRGCKVTMTRASAGVARWRRIGLALVSLTVIVTAAACSSTNTYPIDFFSEMHYQKSFRSQEPPRLDSPPGAVPITGGEPAYSFEEARDLENPLAGDPQARERGARLFALNCVVCHGPEGRGDGRMTALWRARQGAVPPADLTSSVVANRTDGELYWIITNGFTSPENQVQYPGGLANMPAFGKLLTPEERWALVSYIRQLQGR
jgi:mono/diheme cytochrome c family protein